MKTYDELLAEHDAAMREASVLAMSIWRSEFRNESPEFGLCDSPAGVISQIDNMFTGVRQQRDALAAKLQKIADAWMGAGSWPDTVEEKQTIANAINAAPQQCLAEIKAEAIEQAATYLSESIQDVDYKAVIFQDRYAYISTRYMREYAAKIRNTGTWLKDSNVNGGKRQGGE